MSDGQEPWVQQKGEPLLWYKRFTKFRLMEPEHSISAVYREITQNDENNTPGEWYRQAKKWRWEERVAAWDAYQDARLEKRIAREEKKILTKEYALRHKRVEELNRIATKLIGYLEDEDHIWLPDVKSIGTGPDAYQVDLIRFNSPLFSEIRAHFDDIAKEKGERVKKSEITGLDGGPLNVGGQVGFYPVQLPHKEKPSPETKVELPEKGGDANAASTNKK